MALSVSLDVTLMGNGEEFTKSQVPVSAPLLFPVNDFLDIGCGLGTPVSLDYFDDVPCKFNGKIDDVYKACKS